MCPNTAIDVNYFALFPSCVRESDGGRITFVNTDSMVSMGESASSLFISDTAIVDNLDDIGRACPNLQDVLSLTHYELTAASFRNLFVQPKRNSGNAVWK